MTGTVENTTIQSIKRVFENFELEIIKIVEFYTGKAWSYSKNYHHLPLPSQHKGMHEDSLSLAHKMTFTQIDELMKATRESALIPTPSQIEKNQVSIEHETNNDNFKFHYRLLTTIQAVCERICHHSVKNVEPFENYGGSVEAKLRMELQAEKLRAHRCMVELAYQKNVVDDLTHRMEIQRAMYFQEISNMSIELGKFCKVNRQDYIPNLLEVTCQKVTIPERETLEALIQIEESKVTKLNSLVKKLKSQLMIEKLKEVTVIAAPVGSSANLLRNPTMANLNRTGTYANLARTGTSVNVGQLPDEPPLYVSNNDIPTSELNHPEENVLFNSKTQSMKSHVSIQVLIEDESDYTISKSTDRMNKKSSSSNQLASSSIKEVTSALKSSGRRYSSPKQSLFDINKAAEFEERIHFLEHKLKTEMEKTKQEIDNYQIKITDQSNMIYYQNQQIAELQRHLASEISRIQDESKRKVHEVSALVGGQKSTITALEKKLSESDKCNRMLQKEITRLNAQLTAAKNNSQQHKQEVQTNRVTEEVNHLFSKIISKNSKEIKVVENKNNDFKKSWAVKTRNNPAIPVPIKSSELKIVNRPKIPISKSMINLQDTQELVIKRSISLCDMNNVRDDFDQWLINYKTHRLEILKRVKARWMFLAGKLLDQLSNRVKKAQLRGSKMFSVSIKKANESPPIVRRNSARLTKNQLIEQLRNERRLQLNQSEMNSIWVFDNQLPSRRALPDPARLT